MAGTPAGINGSPQLLCVSDRHSKHLMASRNISWVMHHYNTADKYINSEKGNSEATGGSDWQKYMHPKYQKRIFFPELWSEDELKNWGITNLEGYKTLK